MSATDPPTVGGFDSLRGVVSMFREPFEYTERLAARGDVVCLRVLGREFYTVAHPEAIRRMLVTDHHRFGKSPMIADSLSDVAGSTLIAVDGDQWRRLRDVVDPAVTARRVRGYADETVEAAVRLADDWTDGERVDVVAAMKALSLDVLGRALFGDDYRSVAAETKAMTVAMDVRFDVPAQFVPTWVPTPTNRRFERAMTEFAAGVEDLVAGRRSRDDTGDDLLGLLAAAAERGDLSDEELRDQVWTFLFAGHGTTGLALAFASFLLATHPDAQAALHDEAAALDDDPCVADLAELPRAEHVTNEALRLYPPSYELWREATEDVTLRGYRVPAGSQVAIPTYAVHRDGRWWDAPGEFRPERWLGDADRPEYAFLPFGGGPRGCIGMRFARLQLQLALATVARRYRFEPAPGQSADLDLSASVTLQPSDPIELVVRER